MSRRARPEYRALPTRQRRAVRRAARRGNREVVDPGLAVPLVLFARARRSRTSRALVLAVLLILASAAAAVWVLLREGPGPLLAVPAALLLVGGTAGVVSESRLRRAEEAEALAERQLRRQAQPRPATPAAQRPAGAVTPPEPIAPVPGDAARERLARILSGTTVTRRAGERAGNHPWD